MNIGKEAIVSNQFLRQLERKDGKVRPKQKMHPIEWMICIYVIGIVVGVPLGFDVYLLIMHQWFLAFMASFVVIGAILFVYNECKSESRDVE